YNFSFRLYTVDHDIEIIIVVYFSMGFCGAQWLLVLTPSLFFLFFQIRGSDQRCELNLVVVVVDLAHLPFLWDFIHFRLYIYYYATSIYFRMLF
ncbi:Unknown protein, partial [Striga hermonthica]